MTTTQFDEKVECGNDFVAVRIIENCDDLKVGNIYLPQKAEANARLAHCRVESIGKLAADKTGCKIGDYVMIDRLSTYGHTSPVACLKYDSVICLTDEKKTDFWPLKDCLFVEPDDKDNMTKVGNIYVTGYADRLRLGTIKKLNFEKSNEYPFEVGQHVMITKGSDVVQFGEVTLRIYKKDMIICSVDDKKEND